MWFMMTMIPRHYQSYDRPGERSAEESTPYGGGVGRLIDFSGDSTKGGATTAVDAPPQSANGARVAFAAGEAEVLDGPSTEANQVIGGYWMIQAESREEAVEWARRYPASDGDVIEVREVYEMPQYSSDVGEPENNEPVYAQVEAPEIA